MSTDVKKQAPEYSEQQENEFLTREIVGLKITDARYCEEHGYMLEFDDRIRLVFQAQTTWIKRKVT